MVVSTNITINSSSCVSGVLLRNYAAKEYCRQLRQNLINYGAVLFSAKTAKKNSNKQILTIVTFCEILSTVGLNTQQTGRRIEQPQPVTHTENSMTIFPNTGLYCRYVKPLMQYSGAWIGSQRKRPRCALSVGHCSAATRSAFSFKHTEKALTMLYTFIIALRDQKLAQLSRIRTISAIAQNETKARAQLRGLPLVFIRCTPAKGVAA